MGAALIMSVMLNVLLAHRIRSVDLARETKLAAQLLKAGVAVPPIPAKGLDGHQEVLSYDKTGQPTVLYVFTPACVWCARNLENFKTLVDKEGAQFRFLGVSLADQGLTEYVTKNELKLPVYRACRPKP